MTHPQNIHFSPTSQPILLAHAAEGFLQELGQGAHHSIQYPKQERFRELLHSLGDYLGSAAPLLAYTKLTGEAWRQTLPAPDQEDARRLLEEFRAYLRTFGWLDAARPVNVFD